jgi:hypothetical protein
MPPGYDWMVALGAAVVIGLGLLYMLRAGPHELLDAAAGDVVVTSSDRTRGVKP